MIARVEVSDHEIADAVAAVEGEMLELLARLVEAPTTLGNEEPGQVIVANAFRGLLGLEPFDIAMDAEALRSHPAAAPFTWDVTGKRNVVVDWPVAGTGGRSLVLQGHIDVVGPASTKLWRTPPFHAVRDGDWLYGRGSGDMKAGLAAMVGAVLGLQRLGLAPLAPVQLQSVVEEECGGNGALQCVLSGLRPDAAVIPEPYPGLVPTSQVGVLWFHVDIAGTPAHVADAQDGFNAIEASFDIVKALHALEDELNESPPPPFDDIPHPINFNVGVVSGGDWASTVAAECTLSCRIAHYPGTRVAELQHRVEGAVAQAAADSAYLTEHPPSVRYEGFACEGSTLANDEPLVQLLSRSWEAVTGAPAVTGPTTATTDVRAFIQAGVPAACIGPLAERIHGVDERVFVPSVVQTAQVLALFVRDWCGLA
ncbi:MAG: ArgE/DapE family deacylase [Gaiellaceae bacterium]